MGDGGRGHNDLLYTVKDSCDALLCVRLFEAVFSRAQNLKVAISRLDPAQKRREISVNTC